MTEHSKKERASLRRDTNSLALSIQKTGIADLYVLLSEHATSTQNNTKGKGEVVSQILIGYV